MTQLPSTYSFDETRAAREKYIADMTAAGRRVELPAADQLQIDIDSYDAQRAFERSWCIFSREWPEATHEIRASKSGPPHAHVYVTVPGWQLEPIERIALQAALGSDPVRELLAVVRLAKGIPHPTLFVE